MMRRQVPAVLVVTFTLATGGLLAAAASDTPSSSTRVSAEAPAIRLFNGTDLGGWSHVLVDATVPATDVWSVRDGVLVCKGQSLGYLYTNAAFTNFRLVVEWRWPSGAAARLGAVPNSGVLLRVTPEPQGIPPSYEVQLKVGVAGEVLGFWGRALDGDPARRREGKARPLVGDMIAFSALAAAEKPEGEWNRYEITVDGPSITVVMNGRAVNEVTGAQVMPGRIALQSEGGEIHFRTVEVTPLDR
ncbi:DUF1080 domain-containing protein [Luteitalea sp.]|uniref:3-keto-disaccharide hydrolase n=1 Tax=Luteitalea sp. TaxID=2004800 RepID=UPI0025BCCAD0|nr:DUF1080 domain-containing protein [Luteitalea sp.]